jgi:hypothetical protein
LLREAIRCHERLRALVGADAGQLVFVGRIGEPRDAPVRSRSVRRSVPELLQPADDVAPGA